MKTYKADLDDLKKLRNRISTQGLTLLALMLISLFLAFYQSNNIWFIFPFIVGFIGAKFAQVKCDCLDENIIKLQLYRYNRYIG